MVAEGAVENENGVVDGVEVVVAEEENEKGLEGVNLEPALLEPKANEDCMEVGARAGEDAMECSGDIGVNCDFVGVVTLAPDVEKLNVEENTVVPGAEVENGFEVVTDEEEEEFAPN
jgi:hypothetical protein